MFKYYVDKRTINNQPDKYGNPNISYRSYATETPWSEIKQYYNEDELPHLLLVTDIEIMREILDPGNKKEIADRKRMLKDLINSIYDVLSEHGKLVYSNSDYGNYDYTYEKTTYDIQYAEAKAFAKSGYSDLTLCPNVLIIADAANRDLVELTNKIINKHETQINRAIKYLGYKQKNISFIENQNNLSKLREMFSDYSWVDFGEDLVTQQVYEYIVSESGRFDYLDQL